MVTYHFGLGNLKEIVGSGLQLNELALDVHWEPVAIHVLKLREGNHQCLGTMHTLD